MDDRFLHFLNNVAGHGVLPGAHGSGEAGDAACGALIRIFIRFDGARISDVTFQATGSSAAIAAAAFVVDRVRGSDWRDAATLSVHDVAAGLGMKPEEEGPGYSDASPVERARLATAAEFAVEALHAALEDSRRRGAFPLAAAESDGDHVLVAMSGGVDSSAAALLMQRAGRRVTGVTMRLWSDPQCDASGSGCCSPQAVRDARAVCHHLGIPHLTVDFQQSFEATVVDDFVAEYAAGRTPNPCSRCNGVFRFPALVGLADDLGAGTVVTGHYVRLDEAGGSRLLMKAADSAKDQSYVLWGIEEALLGRLEFPLGSFHKEETRRLARAAGLPTHARPESQEVCFIPDDDYRRFLRSRTGTRPEPGEIVDSSGERLGSHGGYMDFTIGQRRGLGISGPEPLYVLATEPERNLVVAGPRQELAISRLTINGINSFRELPPGGGLTVQVRYNSAALPARVSAGAQSWEVEMEQPVYGVAPGQSAVVYAGETLIAGGIIQSTA